MNCLSKWAIIAVCVICLVGCMLAPEQTEMFEEERTDVNKTIFFTAYHHQTDNKAEIWQFDITSREATVLFAKETILPLSAISVQELAILGQLHSCQEQSATCPEHADYALYNLQLSPNKRFLAWIEEIASCPNTGCYGFQQIILMNLANKERQILLESPFHISESVSQSLSDLSWRPNGQQLTFKISSRSLGTSQIQAIDVVTKEVKDISEGTNPFAWSQDGRQLATSFLDSSFLNWSIAVIEADKDKTQLSLLEDNWRRLASIAWSPDGTKLATTALIDHENEILDNNQLGLFLVDVNQEQSQELQPALDGAWSYDIVQWSPNGRWLGVSATSVDWVEDRLFILDPQNNEIVATFDEGLAVDQWSWSDEGESILILVKGHSSPIPPSRIYLFDWAKNHAERIPYPQGLEELFDNNNIYIVESVW